MRPSVAVVATLLLLFAYPTHAQNLCSPSLATAATSCRTPPSLAGEWRVFLPAGYEQRIKLIAEGPNAYRLEPGNLTFSGHYEFRDGRLLSADAADAPRGFFAWNVRSPHLLTLVEQRAEIGSDYTGAILFRPAGE
ncbi:MAG TPA: hypothetical protein VJ783_05290 [Pirellulales bacterium]|nr:hypothetical protein [Pirellulales bacterium]